MATNPETASHDDTDQRKVAEEHRQNALRRLAERGRGNSVDAYDPSIGWTAQAGNGFTAPGEGEWMGDPNQNAPGQVYHVSQLPDPEIARRAGFPPQQVPQQFVIDDLEEAALHPQGPGVGELQRSVERSATEEWQRRDIEKREEVRKAQEDSVGMTPKERADLFEQRGVQTGYEDSQTRSAALDSETEDGDLLERQRSAIVGGNVVAHPQGGAVERANVEDAGAAGGGSETPSDAGSGGSGSAGGPDGGTVTPPTGGGQSDGGSGSGGPDDGGSGEMQKGDDPADFNVDEVNAYLAKVADGSVEGGGHERRRVLNREEKGKGRAGILEGPHGDKTE